MEVEEGSSGVGTGPECYYCLFQMPPPEYSTVYQHKLDEISQFRRELQVESSSCFSSFCSCFPFFSCSCLDQVEYEAEYERALVEVKEELREKEVKEGIVIRISSSSSKCYCHHYHRHPDCRVRT